DYLNNIALHSRLDARVAHFKTAARDGVRINERANVNSVEITRVEASIPVGDDLLLRVLRRIVEQDFEQEAIKLRFGQRVRAFVLNRIFGGKHGEERRERVGFAVNRRLSLFHRFQQRGLRLRRRAIDFVGEQDVREDRAFAKTEIGGGDVEDVRTRDV